MTERRRAHWSDDLIEKVRYVYNSQITYADHDEEMESYYAVIAAVEDWHEKFVMHGAFRVLAERAASAEAEVQRLHRVIAESLPYIDFAEQFAQAEAAIALVRALHGRHDPNCPYGEDCAGAGLCLACREEYPCATIRALDGLEGRIDD